eukprot:SAG31_NODE_1482_length_8175_cov_4.484398_3_plen_43_part_00
MNTYMWYQVSDLDAAKIAVFDATYYYIKHMDYCHDYLHIDSM